MTSAILTRSNRCVRAAAVSAVFALVAAAARADEGMWTLDNPPLVRWKQVYGFEPTPAWLEHVRLASVRFNDGGSGSFVSPDGLVMTNHHVASGQLQKLSSEGKDLVADGFYARTVDEELPCPDLELNVLVSMENVTNRVLAAAEGAPSKDEANLRRKEEIARIEKESFEGTGLRSDVVTLYAGGEYWLYRYRKYTDIRLVFAPEQQAAYFGGDPDNFSWPRHDLDMAFVRVWEDGKPLRCEHFFRWNPKGAPTGDLVFVSGHPGRTDRLETVAQLELQRDVLLPRTLDLIRSRLAALRAFGARGEEQERRAKALVFGYENSLKALTGEYEGLLDPRLMEKKRAEERALRDRVAHGGPGMEEVAGAWDEIAGANRILADVADARSFRSFRGSRLGWLALTIVEWVAEVEKPNEKRFEEFRESALDSLRIRLLSPAPIYADLEEAMLAAALELALERLGPNDPFVEKALRGRTPAKAAEEAVGGTKLADPEFRRALLDGGEAAVEASDDPMIALARAVDPEIRELRRLVEEKVEGVLTAAGEKIAQARFAAYGRSVAPDATFTLRLSYGVVRGYEQLGTWMPPKTTFHGLYDRAIGFDFIPPYDLPPRFVERKEALDLATPLDFVCSADIIGGNSGSPVLDREARIVGLIFDGNIQSLTANYLYDDDVHRAIAVHSAGILQALRRLYDAGRLADEIEGMTRKER